MDLDALMPSRAPLGRSPLYVGTLDDEWTLDRSTVGPDDLESCESCQG